MSSHTVKSALENFELDQVEYGVVYVNPMQTATVVGTPDNFTIRQINAPSREEHDGYAYVEAHSDTMTRYVVVATPLSSVAETALGSPVLVSLVYPWSTTYPVHTSFLSVRYVSEKFVPRGVEPSPRDLVCVTRAIAVALGAKDDCEQYALTEGV